MTPEPESAPPARSGRSTPRRRRRAGTGAPQPNRAKRLAALLTNLEADQIAARQAIATAEAALVTARAGLSAACLACLRAAPNAGQLVRRALDQLEQARAAIRAAHEATTAT